MGNKESPGMTLVWYIWKYTCIFLNYIPVISCLSGKHLVLVILSVFLLFHAQYMYIHFFQHPSFVVTLQNLNISHFGNYLASPWIYLAMSEVCQGHIMKSHCVALQRHDVLLKFLASTLECPHPHLWLGFTAWKYRNIQFTPNSTQCYYYTPGFYQVYTAVFVCIW
jgi:hypothetical protein